MQVVHAFNAFNLASLHQSFQFFQSCKFCSLVTLPIFQSCILTARRPQQECCRKHLATPRDHDLTFPWARTLSLGPPNEFVTKHIQAGFQYPQSSPTTSQNDIQSLPCDTQHSNFLQLPKKATFSKKELQKSVPNPTSHFHNPNYKIVSNLSPK